LKILVSSPNFLLGLVVAFFTTLTIQLIPLSKKASSWNRCLKSTSESLSQVKAVLEMDDESKEVLSVMICNGAVFEPKIKANIK
tara:strand:- start:67 stop:318 length:252 start_codon:yes stop_codon:yes gene_type:complete